MVHGLVFSKSRLPVPPQKITVNTDIRDTIANVTSYLTYLHQEAQPQQAVFVFPVDDDSAVYQFEVDIDGRKIVAECQEKQQAKATFQDATDKGLTAFYLGEDATAGDIFSCQVGNLPPNKVVKVRLSYVIELKYEVDESIRFQLPTILNPRYTPPAKEPDEYVPAPEMPTAVPKTFDFSATICSSRDILDVCDVESYITWKRKPNTMRQAKVTLTRKFAFDHDLAFNIRYSNPHITSGILERGNPSTDTFLQKDAIMLSIFPDLTKVTSHSHHEFIFLIDQSASMDGTKMEAAREALLIFLKSLPVGCRFNIVSFGTRYAELFMNECVEYNEASLAEACKLQSTMRADFGGTDILSPLYHIYKQSIKHGFQRQIFLLTDGRVGNTTDVITLVKRNAHNSRLFTVGIGEGASTALVKGVARASGGRAELISDSNYLQAKVVGLLRASMSATFTNFQAKWNVDVIPIPKTIRLLSNGESLTLYALLNQKLTSDQQIKVDISGTSGQTNINESIVLDIPKKMENKNMAIHRLMAKAKIKELEEEELIPKEKDVSTILAQMILWSTTANVVCRHTAFVACDTTGASSHQPKQAVGTHMIPVEDTKKRASDAKLLEKAMSLHVDNLHAGVTESDGMEEEPIVSAPLVGLNGLVSLQTFTGYWTISRDLAIVFGCHLDQLNRDVPIQNLDVWATILSLAWLQVKCADKRDQWELLAEKANQWLSQQNLEGRDLSALMEVAREKLSKF